MSWELMLKTREGRTDFATRKTGMEEDHSNPDRFSSNLPTLKVMLEFPVFWGVLY